MCVRVCGGRVGALSEFKLGEGVLFVQRPHSGRSRCSLALCGPARVPTGEGHTM